MTVPRTRAAALGGVLTAACLAVAGCGAATTEAGGGRVVTVESGADTCVLSATEAPAGTITFRVRNTGSRVTELYLLAADGKRIVGEVENVGPGLTRELVVTVAAGDYVAACKPGMTGDGIRADVVVTP